MSLSRQQLTLIGIFALFLGPVLLVILMRSAWWQYQPGGLKNQGLLVQPPVQLPLKPIPSVEGKWSILYVLDQPCQQVCIENVTALRQIHRATGRNREHLAIVLLSESQVDADLQVRLESIYPEFTLVTDPDGTGLKTLAVVNSNLAGDASVPGNMNTYVMDPMINVILAYEVDTNPADIHKDLKRLLKWSEKESR